MSVISLVQYIPLHQLTPSPANVRQVPATAAEDAELKASVLARGILQNLLVHPSAEGDGPFLVHAGGRRLKVLQELVAEHVIAATIPSLALSRHPKARSKPRWRRIWHVPRCIPRMSLPPWPR